MVGADELAVEAATRGGIEDVPIDLTVAIDDPVFTGKAFFLDMDVEGVGLGFSRAELATEIFLIHP